MAMPTVIVSLGPESQVVIPGCLSCMCVILVYFLVCVCRTSVGVGLTSMTLQTDHLTALLELGLPAQQSQVVIDIISSQKCTPMHLSIALNNARRARNKLSSVAGAASVVEGNRQVHGCTLVRAHDVNDYLALLCRQPKLQERC